MMSNSEKNMTVRYAFIQGFYWMVYGGISGFASVYLLDCGFSNTRIGMLIAIAGIVSAVLQPALAGYADQPQSPSLRRIIALLMGSQVILGGLLLLTYRKSLLFTGLFYGCCLTILQLLTPFVNSLGMESINQGKRLNFGVARGMGSVGYAIVAYTLGGIISGAGAVSLPVSVMVLSVALFISLLLFPFHKQIKELPKEAGISGSDPVSFLKKYKRFGVVLIGCTLVYISHVLINSFNFQIVESKGGGSKEMGIAIAIAAFVEMPTLFLFSYMLKKVRCDIWFRISGIFFMLKALGSLLAPNIPAYYGIQLFQMLGWGLMTVSSVYFVNSIMDEQDAIKGQAYMTMTYTLASVIGALLGGTLIDHSGVTNMLMIATGSGLVGMVIMLLAAEPPKKTLHAGKIAGTELEK